MKPKTIPADRLRWRRTDIAKRVAKGRQLVVTHYGKPPFALVSLGDLERLSMLPDVARDRSTKNTSTPAQGWFDAGHGQQLLPTATDDVGGDEHRATCVGGAVTSPARADSFAGGAS